MKYDEFFYTLDEYILEGLQEIKSISCNLFSRLVGISDIHLECLKNNTDFDITLYEKQFYTHDMSKMSITQYIGLFHTYTYGKLFKVFYNFSYELLNLLEKDFNINNYNEFRNETFEIFKTLPYKSFGMSCKDTKVFICIDISNRILSIATDDYKNKNMIIGTFILRNTIHKTLLSHAELTDVSVYSEEFKSAKQLLITCYTCMKYLCCSNKDITNKEEYTSNSKPKIKTKLKNTIATWDVGFRVAKFIKQSQLKNENIKSNDPNTKDQNQNNEIENIKLTSKKRSHMRKAHYHSFWTGSKENKKLILKWLSPMLVNFDMENNPITEYKVEE